MPKAQALREAKQWLRWLKSRQVRQRLGIENDAEWWRYVAGLRSIDVDRMVEEIDTSVLVEGHPFEHPYYWAAFILIGDPD